jgi:hypothetical protein
MDVDDNNTVRVTLHQVPQQSLARVLCGFHISPYIVNNYELAFSHRADTSSIVQRTFQYNIRLVNRPTLQDRGP